MVRRRGLYIRGVRILVAPDKFKGTLTAQQAAEAVAWGWSRVRPDDVIEVVPMADGGEGTMDAVVGAMGGRVRPATVSGPLGDPVEAAYGLVRDGQGTGAVVEMALASGLGLLAEVRRRPGRTSTRGTGELMVRAMEEGASRVLVCLGGSATNDGGTGMARAFGYRFLDGNGDEVAPGGAALLDLQRIDATDLHPGLASLSVTGACDVDNPLTGPSGASAVYGPQKGASPEDVLLLDRALGHLAAVVHRDLGIALHEQPGAGAAGGLGFGLLAFCSARLRPGIEVVMDALGLASRIARSDLVITGEGSLDAQSLHGKTPAGVLSACELAGVPAVIVCGRAEIAPDGVVVASLSERVGSEAALGGRPGLVDPGGGGTGGPSRRVGGSETMSGAIDRFTEAARAAGLTPDVRRFPEGTKTAQDAATAIGVQVGQIVKSLIFMGEDPRGDRPVLALTSGANRVDEAVLAGLVGVERLRRATPEEARTATGFAVGGTPPFGHPGPLASFCDEDLLGLRGDLGCRRHARRGVPPDPGRTPAGQWR